MSVKPQLKPVLFGEVLFDCFPDGAQQLGGAPFNVAWHLQAFGGSPYFISKIGQDELGEKITKAMTGWGMDTRGLQVDSQHATGQVSVVLIENEPHYTIIAEVAYDFIEYDAHLKDTPCLLYHGSLALRNPVSRNALEQTLTSHEVATFFDVNLRTPWWHQDDVLGWLKRAHWAKLNEEEFVMLAGEYDDLQQAMTDFQRQYSLQLLLVTLGARGAVALSATGEYYTVKPPQLTPIVDTVGAGDAFTAVLLQGLINDWSLPKTMKYAQNFASKIVGIRGATPGNRELYTLPN
ncbi:MAG: carbohydrate kinase [Gammaproteobacteria bacterium]|nr:carbohydrate kinase [Gammaproteobacteria bacterium]